MSAAEVFNVDYHIEMTDTPSGPCAEVTACLTMLNPESTMIITSLEVDAIELVPSAKLNFSPDTPQCRMPKVKIFRPVAGREYCFSLFIHFAREITELKKNVRLTVFQARKKRGILSIQRKMPVKSIPVGNVI